MDQGELFPVGSGHVEDFASIMACNRCQICFFFLRVWIWHLRILCCWLTGTTSQEHGVVKGEDEEQDENRLQVSHIRYKWKKDKQKQWQQPAGSISIQFHPRCIPPGLALRWTPTAGRRYRRPTSGPVHVQRTYQRSFSVSKKFSFLQGKGCRPSTGSTPGTLQCQYPSRPA